MGGMRCIGTRCGAVCQENWCGVLGVLSIPHEPDCRRWPPVCLVPCSPPCLIVSLPPRSPGRVSTVLCVSHAVPVVGAGMVVWRSVLAAALATGSGGLRFPTSELA